MFAKVSTAADRSKHAARRAISGIVSSASTAHYGRWYYSNRWHPHHALLQRALDETADYITANMTGAMIKRDDIGVLDDALREASADGLYFEFGVRSGRSINHIARRRPEVTVHGFDSFEGLPEPWTGYTVGEGGFGGEGIPTDHDEVADQPGGQRHQRAAEKRVAHERAAEDLDPARLIADVCDQGHVRCFG